MSATHDTLKNLQAAQLAAEKASQQIAQNFNSSTLTLSLENEQGTLDKDMFLDPKGVKNPNSGKGPDYGLWPKAYALIVHYYSEKDKSINRIFVAENDDVLMDLLELFTQAKNGCEFAIIYNDSQGHRVAIKCEKYNDQYHIILMDSTGYDADSYGLASLIVDEFPDEILKNTVLYANVHERQTSGHVCGFYALKDARKMLRSKRLYAELIQSDYVFKGEPSKTQHPDLNKLVVCQYIIPPRFMGLAQSYTKLMDYMTQNPNLSKMVIRTKWGKPQTLYQYVFQVRGGHGVSSPEIVHNQYDPEKPSLDQPLIAYKNKSAFHFQRKYTTKVIPNLLKKLSQTELKNIIRQYNAEYAKLTPTGMVVTYDEYIQYYDPTKLVLEKETERDSKKARHEPVSEPIKDKNKRGENVYDRGAYTEEVLSYYETLKNKAAAVTQSSITAAAAAATAAGVASPVKPVVLATTVTAAEVIQKEKKRKRF